MLLLVALLVYWLVVWIPVKVRCKLSLELLNFVMFICNVALLGDSHYLFYWLVPAIQPRMLVTLDESLSSIGVNVRVGQVMPTS